jgi:arsenite methyltransferase
MNAQSATTQAVINHYSGIARDHGEQDVLHATKVAQAFGYNLQDLTAISDGANMGLSCGNPLALASLIPVYLPLTIILSNTH